MHRFFLTFSLAQLDIKKIKIKKISWANRDRLQVKIFLTLTLFTLLFKSSIYKLNLIRMQMTFIKNRGRERERTSRAYGILFLFYNKLLHFANVLLIEITCENASLVRWQKGGVALGKVEIVKFLVLTIMNVQEPDKSFSLSLLSVNVQMSHM